MRIFSWTSYFKIEEWRLEFVSIQPLPRSLNAKGNDTSGSQEPWSSGAGSWPGEVQGMYWRSASTLSLFSRPHSRHSSSSIMTMPASTESGEYRREQPPRRNSFLRKDICFCLYFCQDFSGWSWYRITSDKTFSSSSHTPRHHFIFMSTVHKCLELKDSLHKN